MEERINYESCKYESCPHWENGLCKNKERYLAPGESTRIKDSYENMQKFIKDTPKETLLENERSYICATLYPLSTMYSKLESFLSTLCTFSNDCRNDPICQKLSKSMSSLNPYIWSENDYCCYHGKMKEMMLGIIDEIQTSYDFREMNLQLFKEVGCYEEIMDCIMEEANELLPGYLY